MCEAQLNLAIGEGSNAKAKIESLLDRHYLAAEAFGCHLIGSSSEYYMMLAKQNYLLSVAGLIKNVSDIYGYDELYQEACSFEAAALSYLTPYDQQSFGYDKDQRFEFSDELRGILRARLCKKAQTARNISAIYRNRAEDADDLEDLVLAFMLDLILDLPTGAWECAPCLKAKGQCSICSYGRDHQVCSHPGSTYHLLSSSRHSMIEIVRRSIKGNRINSFDKPGILNWHQNAVQSLLHSEMDIEDGDCANLSDS